MRSPFGILFLSYQNYHSGGRNITKKAIFFILTEYTDWEGAYLASQLNQTPYWEVLPLLTPTVKTIGGFTITVYYLINDIPNDIDLLVLIGGNSWNLVDSSLFS